MPVSKKRPKLPEEDLAAAVADIINSPITKPNLSFLSLPADTAVVHPKPPGIDSKPVGIGGEPVESADSLDTSTKPSANPTDFGPLPPGVNSTPLGIIAAPSIKPLWQAEGIGTLFEQTRVRRISQAQDALSLVEEKVYDLLWGTKNQRKDEFRLVHYSLQRIGTEARINIKTVRELIPRLIDKGFIQIEHHADVRRNLPTLYRVWSYAGVLANQKRHNRFYVAKSGKGVFYVHPVSASIGPASLAPEDGVKPAGFDLIPPAQRPMGVGIKPTAFNTPPSGVAPRGPMGVADVKPMGGVGSASLGSSLDRFIRQTSPATYVELLKIIKETLNAEADDGILTSIIATSHKNSLQTTGELQPTRNWFTSQLLKLTSFHVLPTSGIM